MMRGYNELSSAALSAVMNPRSTTDIELSALVAEIRSLAINMNEIAEYLESIVMAKVKSRSALAASGARKGDE